MIEEDAMNDNIEFDFLGNTRAIKILNKMRNRNCGIRLRDKKASKEFLRERYEQLKLEGREQTKECDFIRYVLEVEKR
jgi:hypothetical protein